MMYKIQGLGLFFTLLIYQMPVQAADDKGCSSGSYSSMTAELPTDTVDKLNVIFTPELIYQILNSKIDVLPTTLERHGFRVLQYQLNPVSVVVVEHPLISGYVIKFQRDPIQGALGKFKEQYGIFKKRILATRAINAERLREFIAENDFKYVKVPQKYIYYLGANKFPVLLAEKIDLTNERTLNDLNIFEIKEILALVESSQGILDLKPQNMAIKREYVIFFDTERQREPVIWPHILIRSFIPFRNEINPIYHALVDRWFHVLVDKWLKTIAIR